jgi:hypothetical protein
VERSGGGELGQPLLGAPQPGPDLDGPVTVDGPPVGIPGSFNIPEHFAATADEVFDAYPDPLVTRTVGSTPLARYPAGPQQR